MSRETHDPDDLATDRKARAVLAILDRWEERSRGHHAQRRRHQRKPYRTLLVVALDDEKRLAPADAEVKVLRVWARNLSQGGVGFIYPGPIAADRVAVCLDPENGKLWMRARVVRRRPVHEGFWEFGAEFEGRG